MPSEKGSRPLLVFRPALKPRADRADEFLQFSQSLKKANADFEKAGTDVVYRAFTEHSVETTTTRKVIPVIDQYGVPQYDPATGRAL